MLVDAIAAPTILAVDGPTDGTYITGESLFFTVQFSEPVEIAAYPASTASPPTRPALQLTIGSTTRYATWLDEGPSDTHGVAAGDGRVVDQHASLDVPLLRSASEVGARNERAPTINRDALGVEAAPGRARTTGPTIAVDLRERLAERPVLADEFRERLLQRRLWIFDLALQMVDLDEEVRDDAARLHRLVKRLQNSVAVPERVAGEDHPLLGALEEVPQDHGSIARRSPSPFGPSPDQLRRRPVVLLTLSEHGFEEPDARVDREPRQRRDERVELLPYAVRDQLAPSDRRAQAARLDRGVETLEGRCANGGEASAHGRTWK